LFAWKDSKGSARRPGGRKCRTEFT
jgi:hypothetical protein